MATKKRVKPVVTVTDETKFHISKYDLEGNRADVVRNINEMFDRAEQQYANVVGAEVYSDWRPRSWDEGEDLYIYVRRPENEVEKQKREEAEKQRKQAHKDQELKLLLQLQKKYAGKV